MKRKTTIEIDLEVYKAIIQNSNFINEPANDVLHRLLKIDKSGVSNTTFPKTIKEQEEGLIAKGIHLKNGLRLRKIYKGNTLQAEVNNGFIKFNNLEFTSPSGAAIHAVGGSQVNGWRFWDFFDENEMVWKSLETLRS